MNGSYKTNPTSPPSPQQPASVPGTPGAQGTQVLPSQITAVDARPGHSSTIVVVPPVVITPPAQQVAPPPPPAPPAPVSQPEPFQAVVHESRGRGGCGRGAHRERYEAWEAWAQKRRGRRRKFFRFLLFLLVIGLGIGALFRFFNPMAMAFRGVRLDADQRAQLRLIVTDAKRGLYKDRMELFRIQDQMLNLLRKDKVSRKDVDALVASWTAKIKKMAMARTDAVVKAHGTLSPAQRRRLAHNLQRMRDRYVRWRGMWRSGWHRQKRFHAHTAQQQ